MIIVRRLTSADAPEYFKLRVLSEREFPEYVGISAERELLAGESRIGALLSTYEQEGIVAFGAISERELAGIGCISRKLSPKYQHKIFLWGMYVLPAYRRQKVGRLLVEQVIAWARSTAGIHAIQLQVTTTNTAAYALYSRLGFETYGTEKNSLLAGGRFYAVHLMELTL